LSLQRITFSSENEDRKKEIMDLEVPLKAGNSEFIVKFYGGLYAESYIWILSEVMDTSLDKFYLKAKNLSKTLEESFIAKVAYSSLMGISFLKSKNIMHR
jgi:serine/threonine protein kinase